MRLRASPRLKPETVARSRTLPEARFRGQATLGLARKAGSYLVIRGEDEA